MAGLDETIVREKGFNRDDHIHGSLLVLNELFRISYVHWERYYEDLMQKLNFNQDAKSEVCFHRYQIYMISAGLESLFTFCRTF